MVVSISTEIPDVKDEAGDRQPDAGSIEASLPARTTPNPPPRRNDTVETRIEGIHRSGDSCSNSSSTKSVGIGSPPPRQQCHNESTTDLEMRSTTLVEAAKTTDCGRDEGNTAFREHSGNGDDNEQEEDEEEVEQEEDCTSGYLQLTARRRVPNCCAICLSGYEVGDRVVWSSNKKCKHAFHRDCAVDWFVKIRNPPPPLSSTFDAGARGRGTTSTPAPKMPTPCPCCRLEFTDLEEYRRERRIRWGSEYAFNPSFIRFR
jgi:hypothetical protein